MKLNVNPLVTTASSYTSPVIPTDTRLTATFAFNIKISAAASVVVQYTLDDVYAAGFTQGGATWTTPAGTGGATPLTSSGIVQLPANTLATAFQVLVTSNTGTVSIQGWQNVTSIT